MHDNKPISFNLDNPEHCYLLGYFWADCFFGKHTKSKTSQHWAFSFEIKTDDFLEIWPNLKKIGFVKFSTRLRKNSHNTQSKITCCQRSFCEFFIQYGFDNKESGCPLYFQIKREMRKFFIKGFLDGDGSISLDKNRRFRVSFNGAKEQNWDFLEEFLRYEGFSFNIYRKDRLRADKQKIHSYSVVEILGNEHKLKFCRSLSDIGFGLKRKIGVLKEYEKIANKLYLPI
jgi:hypothetical protein